MRNDDPASIAPPPVPPALLSATGVSVVGQILGVARLLLIATYFGLSRELDIYFVVYAVAAMVIFNSSIVYDVTIVPRLMRAREGSGELILANFAARVFRLSCAIGLAATALLLAAIPLLAPLIGAGFTDQERADLVGVSWNFVPWMLCCMPYYAAAAAHKAQRSFDRVFAAELVLTAVSIAWLVASHDTVADLAFACAAGHGAALLVLIPGSGVLGRADPVPFREPDATLRAVGKNYAASQVGSVTGVLDRIVQSYAQPGGIGTVAYSNELVLLVIRLLMLRDADTATSDTDAGAGRVGSMITRLLLPAIAIAGFVAALSHDIVAAVFQRGRFDSAATELMGSVLGIYTLILVPSVVVTALALRIVDADRPGAIYALHISGMVGIALFGSVFVLWVGLGARGVAWTLVLSSSATAIAGCVLATRGIAVGWRRVCGHLACVVLATAVAGVAAHLTAAQLADAWRLPAGAAVYGIAIAGLYYIARDRLRAIARPGTPS